MANVIKKSLLVLTVTLLAGCANQGKQLYAWGQYEELIYQFHNGQNSIEPQAQIDILQSDITKANAKNKKVAPGVYAHLGMLYSSIGEADKAKVALEQESTLFPEAEKFINGMLERSKSAK